MKRLLVLTCLGVLTCYQLVAQPAYQVTQYQEVLPIINPGYAGIENYTDIKFGFRRQWSGVEESPSTVFLKLSSYLDADPKVRRNKKRFNNPYNINQMLDSIDISNNAIRSSNPSLRRKLMRDSIRMVVNKLNKKERANYKREVRNKYAMQVSSKHGFDLSLVADRQGAFSSYQIGPSYAYHLPISESTYLSMGIGVNYLNTGFDRNKATVLDPTDDPIYQDYIGGAADNHHVFFNAGLTLYSQKFHLSYGQLQLASAGGQSDNLAIGETYHNVVGGMNISGYSDFAFAPGFFYSVRETSPNVLQLSGRVYYKENYFVGMTYSDDSAIGLNLGLAFLNQYKLSYAYDYPLSDLDPFGNTNEIIFGIFLKAKGGPKPVIR